MKNKNLWLIGGTLVLIVVLGLVGYIVSLKSSTRLPVIDETNTVINVPSGDSVDIIERPLEDYENSTKPTLLISAESFCIGYGYTPDSDRALVSIFGFYTEDFKNNAFVGALEYMVNQRVVKGGTCFDTGSRYGAVNSISSLAQFEAKYTYFEFDILGEKYRVVPTGSLVEMLMDIDQMNVENGLVKDSQVYKKVDLSNWFDVQKFNSSLNTYEDYDCFFVANLVIEYSTNSSAGGFDNDNYWLVP